MFLDFLDFNWSHLWLVVVSHILKFWIICLLALLKMQFSKSFSTFHCFYVLSREKRGKNTDLCSCVYSRSLIVVLVCISLINSDDNLFTCLLDNLYYIFSSLINILLVCLSFSYWFVEALCILEILDLPFCYLSFKIEKDFSDPYIYRIFYLKSLKFFCSQIYQLFPLWQYFESDLRRPKKTGV